MKIRKAQTGREENPKNRRMATETESYPLAQLFAFLNPEDNTICYQKKWYTIGENTIENIYPAKYRHPWMDHPENKASAIKEVQRLRIFSKGTKRPWRLPTRNRNGWISMADRYSR